MNAVVESVRSLWVPLEGVNLLLPNVAVAEVINYQPLDIIQSGPDWLLGALRWRDQHVPIISMERLCGFSLPQGGRRARISILNSVQANTDIPFYAMVTAGIPRLFSADEDALGPSLMAANNLPDTVADCVQIGSEQALIPNLEVVQTVVAEVWKGLSAQVSDD
jgi:chemosensory pili system protein ChpC